jgi:2,4-dienoyl-CoA reductase-like NADH-dependent reductase (Old Yellow Enzyme family)
MSTNPWPRLNSVFSIRDLELRNRLVFQPHFTALAHDGEPSEDHVAYYEERAAGGVGLVIFEGQSVMANGRISKDIVDASARANVPLYNRIVKAVHSQGAGLFSQLTHCGPDSLEQRPSLMWSPSQIGEPSGTTSTKAMEEEDIRTVVRAFGVSAKNMQEAGFDGVEIKVGHDGLLRAFASPYLNRRTDAYGGSLEGRMRLIVEVLVGIREAVGKEFIVGARICLNEYTPWGYGTEYGLAMAEHIERTGEVDYLNCDAGTASSYWMQIPPAAIVEGSFRDLNAKLKKQSSLPVISFGRVKHPDMAEMMLASGQADLIGMARQLIADPETPKKIAAGHVKDIRFCMASNDSCIFQVAHGRSIRCDHNPAAGRERLLSERRLGTTDSPKNVVVVGGGATGMKAAETLARRGHQVTLFEKEKQLGGLVVLAGKQPYHSEILECIDYLERALRSLHVEVHVGVDIVAEDISDIEADVIIVATGSLPALSKVTQSSPLSHQEPGAGLDGHEYVRFQGLSESVVVSVDDVLREVRLPARRAVVVDWSGHWESVGHC